jgi:hypothetical protein
MGLITIQLFRPNDSDLLLLSELHQKEEIHSDN